MRRLTLLLLIAAALLAGQTLPSGPQALVFLSDVDDSDQPYGLYLPKNYDASKKYPLVVSLHGAYSNHRVNLRRIFGQGNLPGETDPQATRYFPALPDRDFIVACPFARGTMGYQGIAERDVFAVLADVKKRFSIDEDRIYLTGLSMGGGGTLWIALTRPDIFAAIAPVCASIPPGTEALAANALNLPVHLFHGEVDPVVPVDVSRRLHKQFLDLGVRSSYVEFPGVKHNSWVPAYKDAEIFNWFGQFRRNRFPDRVHYSTWWYKYNSAYWVRVDGLTPGELATIDASYSSSNRLNVTTSGLDGFTLQLAGHPKYTPGHPVILNVNGTDFKTTAQESISFLKDGSKWKIGRYEPPEGDKRAGFEGPAREAVASRHIYIYGTADEPKEAELTLRNGLALFASDWKGPNARLALWLRAIADKNVTKADLENSNLVLMGTKETNSVLARYAASMPVSLKADAKDYGLVFVAPADGRLVLVNSGLPWWTGSDRAKRPGLRYLWSPFQVLMSLPDFILFKGSLDNVIAEGNFTRSWKVPEEAAKKMLATGAVEILK